MSGGFKVDDLLRIYCEKGNLEHWEDWMNLFLEEGNLIWHVEEVNTVNTNPFLGVRTQGVLMRLINPENLNHESKESLKIDLDVPITCRGTLYFINDMIYYMTEDEGDLFYKLYSINPNAFLKKAGQPPFKVEKVSYGGRIPKHGETPEQSEVKQIIEALNGVWEDHLHDDALNPGGSEYAWRGNMAKSFFFKDLWENGYIEWMFNGEYREGNPVYDNIKKYVYNQGLDEGFMPENVEGVLPPTGGGRKKRRKRRKTKTKKSKTKKTRRRKSKKK
jgi:hypothetical protein